MKGINITVAGHPCFLFFNGAAMFAIEDAFGGSSEYLEKAGSAGKDGFEAVCTAAAILAEQGELTRRALGYDKAPIVERERVLACTTPCELLALRQATVNAILLGYGREVESENDVDIGLAELEQKKTRS